MPTRMVTIHGTMTWEEPTIWPGPNPPYVDIGGPMPQPPPGRPAHPIYWPPVISGGPIDPYPSHPIAPGGPPPWVSHPIPPTVWPTPPGRPPLGTWGGDAPWPGYATPPIALPPWWPGAPTHPIPPSVWPQPPTGGGGEEQPPATPGGPVGGPSHPVGGVPGPSGKVVWYWSPIWGWIGKPAGGPVGPEVPPTPPIDPGNVGPSHPIQPTVPEPK
jgi:hypothetical protein